MRRLAALFALLMALVSSAAWAQLPARPAGPVADYANIISPQDEAVLDTKLRAYNEATGRAIIVATVPSLDDEDVGIYTRNLAEAWGIGGAKSENGVLLLVAPNERKMWISTARGVQERLTDIMSGRIYRDVMTPRFKAGDMSGGIVAGVDAIIAQLDMDPAQARAIEEAQATAERARGKDGGFPIGALFWLLFAFLFFILPMLRGGKRRRSRSPWGNTARDIILWEAGSAIARGVFNSGDNGSWGGGGGGGGFGGFGGGGGGFNGGGAGGGW